jgi:hypothetical protein
MVPVKPETVTFEGYGVAMAASLIVIASEFVNVAPGSTGVGVVGGVADGVTVAVGVTVGMAVGVDVGVRVGVAVAVAVAVGVAVAVAVAVGVTVGGGVELPVVKIKEKPSAIKPESPSKESTTYKLQIPLGFCPPNVPFNVAVPVGAGWL